MVDSEYGDGPWNDEKMVLNQMNQEFEEGEIVGVDVFVKGEIVDVEVFVVELRVLMMIVRRLVVRN